MKIKMLPAALAACVALSLATQADPAELALPKDGWASWQVEAVDGAPAWCCWKNWDERDAPRTPCNLDRDGGNYGSRDDETTDALRVYARVSGGKVERVRVLAASCPVEAATPIRSINSTTDDSARWLVALSKRSAGEIQGLRDQVIPALAMHRGAFAQNELLAIARGDGPVDTSQNAIFWLALVRGATGAEAVTDLMFNDQRPELRKHAAFAITQSKSPNAAESLIRLGNTDKDGDVRARAWFWLAHTGAPNAETAIIAALRKDDDHRVREEAIVALSRLPDERAARALIAAAEDRSLSQEQRKRAVFWLGQSESKVAQAYLDKILTGSR